MNEIHFRWFWRYAPETIKEIYVLLLAEILLVAFLGETRPGVLIVRNKPESPNVRPVVSHEKRNLAIVCKYTHGVLSRWMAICLTCCITLVVDQSSRPALVVLDHQKIDVDRGTVEPPFTVTLAQLLITPARTLRSSPRVVKAH